MRLRKSVAEEPIIIDLARFGSAWAGQWFWAIKFPFEAEKESNMVEVDRGRERSRQKE